MKTTYTRLILTALLGCGVLAPSDSLGQTSAASWAITPQGLVVYFDFPHVMAVFDKNFVPYSVVSEYLNPNGPAVRFRKN